MKFSQNNINQFKLVFVALAFTFLMSSCIAFHDGSMKDSASLSQANFEYIMNNASGESKASYFLGLGGWGGSLIAEAKHDLTKKYRLSKNQAFANVTVSYKTTYFIGILVVSTQCVVTADVVEFTK
jgi:hypothetical protein